MKLSFTQTAAVIRNTEDWVMNLDQKANNSKKHRVRLKKFADEETIKNAQKQYAEDLYEYFKAKNNM